MRWYFAPMQGITTYVYRAAHRRYFAEPDRYYMPFFSPTKEHLLTDRELAELRPEHNQGTPAIPQIMTRQAEDFLWAAGELAAMGYREVNLNLGCPSGTVTAKGKGSALLGKPEELDRLLDRIFSESPISVSIKTRLGIRDPEEFGPLLEIYNQYPVAELTIHARVQQDFYRLPARMESFAAMLPACRMPVCYNGDLLSAADCAAFSARFPTVAAVMLGRGAAADPAIFSRVRGGSGADRETLRTFCAALFEGYCSAYGCAGNAVQRMKELWMNLFNLFADSARYEGKMRRASSPAEYRMLEAAVFRELRLLDEP